MSEKSFRISRASGPLKEGETWRSQPAARHRFDLEPQLRTNRNSHVIVCAAVEVDIVANFSPQTNRTSKDLNSSPPGKPRNKSPHWLSRLCW